MDQQPVVLFKRFANAEGLAPPAYHSALAAGADIRAALLEGETIILQPGERRLIPTGFAVQIPPGFEGQMRPRSGLSVKYGVTMVNTPGTIDADYRGEMMVNLINLGSEPFAVKRGERIAQLIIAPVSQAIFEEVRELDETARGAGGFGSTGV